MQYIESSRTYTNTLLLLEVLPPARLVVVAGKAEIASRGLNHATSRFPQVGAFLKRSTDDTWAAAFRNLDFDSDALKSVHSIAAFVDCSGRCPPCSQSFFPCPIALLFLAWNLAQ